MLAGMLGVAVLPRQAGSIHLVELPQPKIEDVPDDRGVLVKVLRVGLDGTDKEICAGEYGTAPSGCTYLVIGHESFGRVLESGANAAGFSTGDYVVSTSRRRGGSMYDFIGTYDMTPETAYVEPGISLKHGFLADCYVDDPDYLIRVPSQLKDVAVLLEPLGIVEKGIGQAFEIQKRLKVWRPERAAVVGAGSLGLLATLLLRLMGLDVVTLARRTAPTANSQLVEELGARYVSTNETPLLRAAQAYGPFDLIFEATGASEILFEAMEAAAANAVVIITGISGGKKTINVNSDRLMLSFVLGNKVVVGTVSENRTHLEQGVKDMALAGIQYPGWLEKLITHRVRGLDNYLEMISLLNHERDVIKLVVEVAPG
jgi:glucose 1-dehydrogenase